VYLVQDANSASSIFALKKIRCPFGAESVAQAMKEVEAYDLFEHPNIIRAIDHAVISGDRSDAQAKTVYILLPYYRRGNLQDAINANLVNSTSFPEKDLLKIFLGVCRALKGMHQYQVDSAGKAAGAKLARNNQSAGESSTQRAKNNAKKAASRGGEGGEEDDEVPLMEGEGEVAQSQQGMQTGELRPYAHRDIKPGKDFYFFLALNSEDLLLTMMVLTRQYHVGR
jgi:serine/threonine kinase 16